MITPARIQPTPSNELKSGVFLSQFDSGSLRGPDGNPVDWFDHEEAHRAVSRLFPIRLPGPVDQRRAASGILFRRDATPDGGANVLVQSLVKPELVPENARVTEVSRARWQLGSGANVALRLAVNPVRRTTRYFADSRKTQPIDDAASLRKNPANRLYKHSATAIVPVQEVPEYVASKLSNALGEIEIINHFRDVSQSRRRNRRRLVIDTIDALGVVRDPDALDTLRIEGVGRSRAYGAGLLTVRQIG